MHEATRTFINCVNIIHEFHYDMTLGHLKYVGFFFKNEDISSADTFDVLRE